MRREDRGRVRRLAKKQCGMAGGRVAGSDTEEAGKRGSGARSRSERTGRSPGVRLRQAQAQAQSGYRWAERRAAGWWMRCCWARRGGCRLAGVPGDPYGRYSSVASSTPPVTPAGPSRTGAAIPLRNLSRLSLLFSTRLTAARGGCAMSRPVGCGPVLACRGLVARGPIMLAALSSFGKPAPADADQLPRRGRRRSTYWPKSGPPSAISVAIWGCFKLFNLLAPV